MKSDVLAEPVLVGRERELEELESFLNSAAEGKGKTVFISGEAGSGKTRLTREFLNAAKKKGVAVMAGWCLSDAAVPYFPFVEAFNSYFASSYEEEQPVDLQHVGVQFGLGGAVQMVSGERGITAWLAGAKPIEKPGGSAVLSPQVWKDQVFAGVAKTLHGISVQEPIVLFIEDIHWADSASLALLHYVARATKNSERILVMATFRSEELTADAEGHPHPLAEALRMMRREDLFTEVKLSSLNQANISKLAENMIGGSLQPRLAEKLTVESGGNALFIVESLRMLSERKSLIQENDQWRLAVDELSLPSKIKDIILRRLAVLKYAQRRVLDAASVIGEKFDVELLSTVLGQDSLEVLETLNMIAHSTSLVCVEEDFYRFDHAKSRETLYDELSPPLKRGYHGRIAEKLESAKGATLPLSDLAFHYDQAGNKEKSLKYALAAAKDELARFSNLQAIKHFEYALQNMPEGPEHALETRIALEGLGDAYAANSMYAEAIKIFDALAAAETGAVRLRALRKAMDAAFFKGDKPEILLEYAKKAEELAGYDRLEMARVLNNRGRAFGFAGRGNMKMDLGDYDAALQVFEEENSLPDAADALWRSGVVCTLFKDLSERGLGELLRSVAIFRELGDVRKEIEATLHTGLGFSVVGLYPEANREFTDVLRMGEKLDVFGEMAQASAWLGYGLEGDGKLAEALSLTLKAFEYFKKTDVGWLPGLIFPYLTRQYSKLGDLNKAGEYVDATAKLSPDVLSHAMTVGEINVAKGVYLAAKNEWDKSNQIFEGFLEQFKTAYTITSFEIGVRGNYIWVLEKHGRAAETGAQWKRIQELFEQAEMRFGHANVQANLMVQRKVQVGEEFEMRLDLVNVGRKPALLVEAKNVLLDDFKVTSLPSWYSIQEGAVKMKNKEIGPFQVNTAKLTLKSLKAGTFTLNPHAVYVDDLGETRTCTPNPITITVQPAQPKFEVLPGRVPTGFAELDALLFGGMPQNYAVALTSPSTDEREMLVKGFLEEGAKAGETTFHITSEAGYAKALAEKYPSNFYLFVCNPQADAMIQNLPHVFKLKGVENLTEIDIALTRAFRSLNLSAVGVKRICIEIVSDALLQHHAVITRRWLSALLPTLKSKGFTALAIVDPHMHPPEEVQAILGLFDGEIRVFEKETPQGAKQTLRIRKLLNQKYLENEIVLTKERLFE